MPTTTAISLQVEGIIYAADGKQIKNATVQMVYIPTGTKVGDPVRLTNEYYSAWTDEQPESYGIIFSAPGYKTRVLSIADLAANADVILQKGFTIPLSVILAVLSAVFIIRKRKKKVGAFGTGDAMTIFYLVGGVIAFSVIKKTLEGLGLWDSQDTKDLDNAASDPNSFWNPNYWQTIKPANQPWTYAITDTTALAWSKEIYNAFGPFNDDEETAIAVFKRCRTKANASFLAYIFQGYYGQDLLSFLRGGNWPQDRLSDADVNTINSYIKNLPKY